MVYRLKFVITILLVQFMQSQCSHMIRSDLGNDEYHLANRNRALSCDSSSKYRSIDGTCNNLEYPERGMSFIRLKRLIPAIYDDGFNVLQDKNFYGPGKRPNVRNISSTISSATIPLAMLINDFFTVWGQFITHDILHSKPGTNIECCNVGKNTPAPRKGECQHIRVSGDDFYDQFDVKCIKFIRDFPDPIQPDPHRRVREQINRLTAYLDGSVTYGSISAEEDQLRTHVNGKLVVSTEKVCVIDPPPTPCDVINSWNFLEIINGVTLAGDIRADENPGLSSVHNILVRLHNDLAERLFAMDSSLDDETIFQEVRRIVGAVLQAITYKDFIPILLNPEIMEDLKIKLEADDKHTSNYDKEVDASIVNSFSFAFRYGHSEVRDFHPNKDGIDDLEMVPTLNNPFIVRNSGSHPHQLLAGQTKHAAEGQDTKFADSMHNKLFAKLVDDFLHGLDLFAINIHRARDHGIASYLEFRKICNLPNYDTWDKLKAANIIDPNVFDVLKNLYGSIKDVEFYVGALAELGSGQTTGIVGPTFQCIIGHTFKNLMYGDRYFFQLKAGINPYPFTEGQLKSLKATTYASILCKYTGVKYVSPNAFLMSTAPGNGLVSCVDYLAASYSVVEKFEDEWDFD